MIEGIFYEPDVIDSLRKGDRSCLPVCAIKMQASKIPSETWTRLGGRLSEVKVEYSLGDGTFPTG